MLDTRPSLKVGDELYGHKVIRVEQQFSNKPLRAVTVEVVTASTRGGHAFVNVCFWYTDLPDGTSGWVPTQVGPHGSYSTQNPANPNWWTDRSEKHWVCIHNSKHGDATEYDALCDGECGEPDVPVVFPTDEEVAEAAERARRLLDSVRP